MEHLFTISTIKFVTRVDISLVYDHIRKSDHFFVPLIVVLKNKPFNQSFDFFRPTLEAVVSQVSGLSIGSCSVQVVDKILGLL